MPRWPAADEPTRRLALPFAARPAPSETRRRVDGANHARRIARWPLACSSVQPIARYFRDSFIQPAEEDLPYAKSSRLPHERQCRRRDDGGRVECSHRVRAEGERRGHPPDLAM